MMSYGHLQNIERCYLYDNNAKIPQFAGFFVLGHCQISLLYIDNEGKKPSGLKKKNYFCNTT